MYFLYLFKKGDNIQVSFKIKIMLVQPLEIANICQLYFFSPIFIVITS